MLAVAAGCGSNGTNTAGSSSVKPNEAQVTANKGPVDASKTIKYSVLLPFFADTPDTQGPIFKKFEEITNTQIGATFVPSANLLDKINVIMASGDMPDVIVAIQGNGPSGNSPGIVNAARSGAFWEIGPYLDRFPNLKKNRTVTADRNISIDGKIYGLYKPTPLSRKGFNIRQDWLDNLKLKVPTTTDELYQVLKAFTENDPDHNGKNDTVGLEDRLNTNGMPESFDTMAAKFGVPNKFALKDGKIVPDFMTPEYMNTLEFYRKLYSEKLMNNDFAYVKAAQLDEAFARSQAGVHIGNVDELPRWISLFKNSPNAKLTTFVSLKGPGGDHSFSGWGYNSYLLFPKTSVKTEDRLIELLSAINRNADLDKTGELSELGIEGVTYKTENGKPVITNKKELATNAPIFILTGSYIPPRQDLMPDWEVSMRNEVEKNAKILVDNPVAALLSQTLSERGGELSKIVSNASIRYILGDLDKAGFQKEVDKWKSQGGDKVLQELMDQLKK
jgi:putative aldouronate transport system substrate-binding protein